MLEAISRLQYASNHEVVWMRSALTNRANFLKDTVDRLSTMREIVQSDIEIRRSEILRADIGILFLDGEPVRRNG